MSITVKPVQSVHDQGKRRLGCFAYGVQIRKGISVSGLVQENFQVDENGVIQPITYFSHEDIPLTVGLVVDSSGSMSPKRTEVIVDSNNS